MQTCHKMLFDNKVSVLVQSFLFCYVLDKPISVRTNTDQLSYFEWQDHRTAYKVERFYVLSKKIKFKDATDLWKGLQQKVGLYCSYEIYIK